MSHYPVKNPCKICSQSVNNKTGLQCKGACRKWAHFTCLDYTASKIEAIKAGEMTIICPCPNCNTGESNLPKSSSFTEKKSFGEVIKSLCSSKGEPRADSSCPSHDTSLSPPLCGQKLLVIPPLPDKCPDLPLCPPKHCESPVSPKQRSASPPLSLKEISSSIFLNKCPHTPPCPPGHCASPESSKKLSTSPPCPPKEPTSPLVLKKSPLSPPHPPADCKCPIFPKNQFASPPCPPKEPISPLSLKKSPPSPSHPPGDCKCPICPKKQLASPLSPAKEPACPQLIKKSSESPPCPPKRSSSPPSLPKRPVSPPRPTNRPTSRPCPAKPCPVPTVDGDYKHSITIRKSKSCSCAVSLKDAKLETSITVCTTSDTLLTNKCKENQRILYTTLEQLCNTVGLLSTQIKEIIGKLVAEIE